MSNIYTYSSEYVDFIIGGYKVKGWNEIRLTPKFKRFRQVDGIRGKNTRVRNVNSSAMATISVPRTSPINTVFSEVVRQDTLYGTGRLVFTVRDKLGTTLLSSSEAYINGYPAETFNESISDRVWEIEMLSVDTWVVGGNETKQETIFGQLSGGVEGFLNSLD